MSIWKRLKNLWELSKYNIKIISENKRVILTDKTGLAQFMEPVSYKEKFKNVKNVSELLDN